MKAKVKKAKVKPLHHKAKPISGTVKPADKPASSPRMRKGGYPHKAKSGH